MPEAIYEALALIMSYWFVLLGGLIVLRGMQCLRRDVRARRRALLALPDAGSIGELAVARDAMDVLEKGLCVAIPPEGILGSARACDVRIAHEEVPGQAAQFLFTQEGLLLTPWPGTALRIDGEVYSQAVTVGHGNRLQWGGLILRLRLFEGAEAVARTTAPMAPARVKRRSVDGLEEDAAKPGAAEDLAGKAKAGRAGKKALGDEKAGKAEKLGKAEKAAKAAKAEKGKASGGRGRKKQAQEIPVGAGDLALSVQSPAAKSRPRAKRPAKPQSKE